MFPLDILYHRFISMILLICHFHSEYCPYNGIDDALLGCIKNGGFEGSGSGKVVLLRISKTELIVGLTAISS